MEPRFNEPLFNEVLDITNDILCPGQSYSKMYRIELRYNEPRYNEFFDITNIIRKPKRKIYLDVTNYNVNTRQKINAEQINSQQILCDSEPRLHSKPFLTKKQLNPSCFGNKNYKLIVLEGALHSVRGTVTKDTTAIVRFTLYFTSFWQNHL